MQGIATFRFCDTLRFAPIQNLRYSGQSTAGMVVRVSSRVFEVCGPVEMLDINIWSLLRAGELRHSYTLYTLWRHLLADESSHPGSF